MNYNTHIIIQTTINYNKLQQTTTNYSKLQQTTTIGKRMSFASKLADLPKLNLPPYNKFEIPTEADIENIKISIDS